jgi:hypothetical protein
MLCYEIICEGRDAPLYHATGLATAVQILKDNALQGWDAPISLTRNRRFAQFWAERMGSGVVLVLDQTKLAQHFRLEPVLHFRTQRHEAEETVALNRPIKPLDRYLTGIEITARDLDRIRGKDRYDILTNHPLLRVVRNPMGKVGWMP